MKTEPAEMKEPTRIMWKGPMCIVKAVIAGSSRMISSGLTAMTLPYLRWRQKGQGSSHTVGASGGARR